jgi:hypothetical protein
LFVTGQWEVAMRDHVDLDVSVRGASMPMTYPAEVVFVLAQEACKAGQQPGVGVTIKITDSLRAATVLYCQGRFAEVPGALEATRAENSPPPPPRASQGIRPARQIRPTSSNRVPSPSSRPGSGLLRAPAPRASRPTRTRQRARKITSSNPAMVAATSRAAAAPPADPAQRVAWLDGQARTFLARSQNRSHYGVLELEPAAERSAVRDRYVELMRKFHPDNYYRRVEGELLGLLEDAYQQITDAYETLIDKERRAAYDDEIRNFHAPTDDDGAQRAERIRARAFEKKHPRRVKLAHELLGEAKAALDVLRFTEAAKKAKLALSYHPHMVEAQSLLRTLEEEGHGG